MRNNETFETLFQQLTSSQTEEEVILNLKKILKYFPSDTYKSIIISNPFFKSLLPEIIDDVFVEIDSIRQSLQLEIKEIDSELDKVIGVESLSIQVEKLKDLKRDCISLIFEIDERKKDLKSLVK